MVMDNTTRFLNDAHSVFSATHEVDYDQEGKTVERIQDIPKTMYNYRTVDSSYQNELVHALVDRRVYSFRIVCPFWDTLYMWTCTRVCTYLYIYIYLYIVCLQATLSA